MDKKQKNVGTTHDTARRKCMAELSEFTGRNVIIYYSGWLQRNRVNLPPQAYLIDESDKTGFMSALRGMDKKRGLDLLLHTPGGSVSDAESLVEYLRSFFDGDLRVVVPQVAKSAGTMIALASRTIVMGRQSRLGPIGPKVDNILAQSVIQEYQHAAESLKTDPDGEGRMWLDIVMKHPPTLYITCTQAVDWVRQIVTDWLVTGMFHGEPDALAKAERIVNDLSDMATNKSQDRQVSVTRLKRLGVNVVELEDDQSLQDTVLAVHHATIRTLIANPICKIIENHDGVATMTRFRPLAQAHG
ncbi:MAG: SDH family Clp fold serine proteinase [Bradymonadaceae bacterium]